MWLCYSKGKYVTTDGHFELVFSGVTHTLYTEQNNSLDMETFNYVNPRSGKHWTFDVFPYDRYLNTQKDYDNRAKAIEDTQNEAEKKLADPNFPTYRPGIER